MKTEARFLLAVVLMLGVLVVTNRLFPPVGPEEGVLPDTTGAEPAPATRTAPTLPEVPTRIDTPDIPPVTTEEPAAVEAAPDAAPERIVTVEGPLYRYSFSSIGARLLSAELPRFEALDREGVVDLVPDFADGYLGHTLVVGSDTVDLGGVPFRVEPEAGLRLQEGGEGASLRFVYEHPTSDFGVEIEYAFEPGVYSAQVTGRVRGARDGILLTDLGAGLAFAEADSAQEARLMAYVVNHLREGIRSRPLDDAEPGVVPGPMLWAAFKSKFFVLAMLSGESEAAATADRSISGLLITRGPVEDRIRMAAAQELRADGTFGYRLFMGPQEYARLSSLGQGLEEVNPYGWRFFRPIIRPFVSIIMTILVFLHTQLALGYGWVLVVFGVLMRVVLWPLNHKAMKAQLRNMAVQPLVQEIQKKHKDNPEKLQKEMMRLYKEHGFNPLAGCLPLLLPWPVLIALFFVFQNTIELRGVDFLWLPDLSAKDPIYILPVILAVSMFLMQWVSLKSLDAPNPQMKMMMYIMPPMMLVIFANLASGLNLYYATANIATIPQQIWIANERKKMRGKPPPKLSSD